MKIKLLIALCAALLVVACEENNVTMLPDAPCTAAKPSTVARVVSSGCDAQNCAAAYSASGVIPPYLRWDFPGGTPGTAFDVSGGVSWKRETPMPSKQWALIACGCRPEQDVSGASCSSVSGDVSF